MKPNRWLHDFKFGRGCCPNDRHYETISLTQLDTDPPALPIYLADNEGTPGSVSLFEQDTRRCLHGYFGAATMEQVEESHKRRVAICRHAARSSAQKRSKPTPP